MPGRKLKLGSPEIAAVIDQTHASEPEIGKLVAQL